ncbi:ABC transporter substrate-binding protein [Bacillus lacus]|uniref:ABC transporter substrate-binding protein n=1 Tax=Metabacillus lacus TaxID=1983721 RepID=A0A7X2J2D9_9BACI|nr:siderophore ABC transporter substrate-binding protein [Metabacillus lacus]MRX73842.1 ABC transporter substrate-binding protein [Metabacillus lacus]
MKKLSYLTFIMAVMLLLAACGNNQAAQSTAASEKDSKPAETEETVTVKHQYGEVTVTKNPQKAVVFDFGVLDTLDVLGADVAGVPQLVVPQYLQKYAASEYTNVGSLKEPDFEAIHALKPDVIYISARQAELYKQFEEIAPTILVETDYADYLGSLEKNVEMLGKIYGKEDIAEKALNDLKAKASELSEKTGSSDSKALILLANEGKVSAYGAGSRYGFIHDVFGFKQSDENIEVSQHGQSITFEYILERNPDVMFVIDRSAAIGGEAGAQQTVENDLVKKTSAFENGKIVYLDGGIWYLSGGGLQSVNLMMEEVEKAL